MKPLLILCSCTDPGAPEDEADTWRTAQEMGQTLSQAYAVEYANGDDKDIFERLHRLKESGGVVLNMMERPEDVRWPAILGKIGVPYSGCDAFSCTLSTNKPWMKLFADRVGMRCPRGVTVSGAGFENADLSFPVILKPAAEDASVGIRQANICSSRKEVRRRLVELHEDHPGPWLIEEYVPGTDLTLPFFACDGTAHVLPALEVQYDKSAEAVLPILSYEAKWEKGHPAYTGHTEICPADLPEEVEIEITTATERLVGLLDLSGYARVDFRLDENRTPWFLELNANPRVSESDCYFVRAAKEADMSYFDTLSEIIRIACRRDPA
ncbi:MAG: hypothetical protein GXP25_00040 [Planctomycetes bacterium]|nr:hypothetical protein [Planctomycetota bacterium]